MECQGQSIDTHSFDHRPYELPIRRTHMRRINHHCDTINRSNLTRRLGWRNADSKRKYHFLRADRLLLVATIVTCLTLSGLSVHYSRTLSMKNNETVNERKKSTDLSVHALNSTSVFIRVNNGTSKSLVTMGKSGKYDNHRVYCMIPFIWNKEIYDVSEFLAFFGFRFIVYRAII